MVEDKIKKDIEGSLTNFISSIEINPHNLDFSQCLVEPSKQKYYDIDGKVIELWLVLKEDAEMDSGYQIVYDEKSGLYGLAGAGGGVGEVGNFFGYHGSFLDTVAGM